MGVKTFVCVDLCFYVISMIRSYYYIYCTVLFRTTLVYYVSFIKMMILK